MGRRERREQSPNLAARSRVTPGGGGRASGPATGSGSGARHCWVSDEGLLHPGLLLEWRQQDGRWEGLVAFVRTDEQGFALVQAWLDSQQLTSASQRP